MTATRPPGRIEMLNDQQLYFEVHGIGEPLLLLHGFSGSSQDWVPSLTQWGTKFQLILPDLRGHGRSGTLAKPFRHKEAAADMLALLDHLKIASCRAVGISGGGSVLLHMATKQAGRIQAMVLVSATSYFPAQARSLMSDYPDTLSQQQWETLRRRHPGGDEQIKAILASTKSFATSYDDLNFTPPLLSSIEARTFIIQGDRDPLYPVELSVEMAKAIPNSRLWIIPNAGHGPVLGARWSEFQQTASSFLEE